MTYFTTSNKLTQAVAKVVTQLTTGVCLKVVWLYTNMPLGLLEQKQQSYDSVVSDVWTYVRWSPTVIRSDSVWRRRTLGVGDWFLISSRWVCAYTIFDQLSIASSDEKQHMLDYLQSSDCVRRYIKTYTLSSQLFRPDTFGRPGRIV